jgi:hypothetical protein
MMLGDKLHTKNNENTNLNDIIPLNTHDPNPRCSKEHRYLSHLKLVMIMIVW